jgi:hypothetical protein
MHSRISDDFDRHRHTAQLRLLKSYIREQINVHHLRKNNYEIYFHVRKGEKKRKERVVVTG